VWEGAVESFLDQAELEFRDHLARWVKERLQPRAEELDRTGAFARDLFQELAALGYFGIMYPEKYGGMSLGSPYIHYTILCEELAAASMGFAATVCMHASTATHTIYKWKRGPQVTLPYSGDPRREDRRLRHH
jgi:alkylation response protein AidB-like acyl-CoA dehydrogenase